MTACLGTFGLPTVSVLIVISIYILARMLLKSLAGCARAEIEDYVAEHDIHCSCCEEKINTEAFGFTIEVNDDEEEYEEPEVTL